MSDGASQALARGVPHSFYALADHSEVPRSTLHNRAHGRRSIEDKAISQQYLYPWEEAAFVKFLLQMSALGFPVRIKFIPELAFMATEKRRKEDRPPKLPVKNWAKAFEVCHPDKGEETRGAGLEPAREDHL